MKIDSSFRNLLLGLLLFFGGLFLGFSNAIISISWFISLGKLTVHCLVLLIPIICGIVLRMIDFDKTFTNRVIILGLVIVVLGIMNMIKIEFFKVHFIIFIIMFIMMMTGLVLILKNIFAIKKTEE